MAPSTTTTTVATNTGTYASSTDTTGMPEIVVTPPKVEEKKKFVIIHKPVCSGNTRCDRCRRLGCDGCIYPDGEHIGLCAICARKYASDEVLLHEEPSEEEKKKIPALVMPPAKFKKKTKICVTDVGASFSTYELMAKALGAEKWARGINPQQMQVYNIVNMGLNMENPRKGYVYLIEDLGYPNRQYLIGERGLDNSKDLVNFKMYCVGQMVRVRKPFPKAKFYDPSYSSAMSNNGGQIFYVGKKDASRRCYNLIDDHTLGTYAHEWLEPIRPIIREDRPPKQKPCEIKNPLKKMVYMPWIKLSWRQCYGPQPDKTKIRPREKYDQGSTDLKNVKIDKALFEEFVGVHTEFVNYWGVRSENNTGQAKPLAFIIGEKNGVAMTAIPCFNDFKECAGCGQMVSISTDEFNRVCKDLIKMKFTPVGIARIGTFSVGSEDGRGPSLNELSRVSNMYVLSIGRDGMRVQSMLRGYPTDHSYEVVKNVKKGGATDVQIKTEVVPVETSSS